MTVNDIVSYMRGVLNEHDDSLGPFVDSFLWETFLIAEKDISSNLRLRRFNLQNPLSFQSFCMDLEQKKSHECGCITGEGCDVLITKNELPPFYIGRNTPSLTVMMLNGKEIEKIEEHELEDIVSYNPMFNNKTLTSIVNNKLVIWNNLEIPYIRVKAIWDDITDIDSAQYCGGDSSVSCIDVMNTETGVSKDLMYSIVRRMIEILEMPARRNEDITNDSSNLIKT